MHFFLPQKTANYLKFLNHSTRTTGFSVIAKKLKRIEKVSHYNLLLIELQKIRKQKISNSITEVESRSQGSRPRPRTQKIRGQGQEQPFRGQTLSRPRTGMLEAKAKDQGHKHKCSPKTKKGLHKHFSGDLQKKKRSSQKFSGDLHKKTFFKTFFKRSTKF